MLACFQTRPNILIEYFYKLTHRIFAAQNESDLSARVGGRAGVGVVNHRVQGEAFLHQSANELLV